MATRGPISGGARDSVGTEAACLFIAFPRRLGLEGARRRRGEATVLRARWDGRDVDHKAVGGHLPLSKRNSTPVGAAIPTSSAHAQLLQQAHAAKASLAPMEPQNLHRRLDRSHSEPVKSGDARQPNSSRYKTELCRPFEENGHCKYGEKCQFAHGQLELRTLTRHPKYKTELCRTFHTIGFCPYGPRCHFIHNAEERRGSNAGAPGSAPHAPLSPKGSLGGSAYPAHAPLSRQQVFHMSSAMGGPLGSTAESPSPPASFHGSPTSSAGSFFDDSFTLFAGGSYGLAGAKSFLDGLTVGLGSTGMAAGPGSPGGSSCSGGNGRPLSEFDMVREGALLSLAGLDTPPDVRAHALPAHGDKRPPLDAPQQLKFGVIVTGVEAQGRRDG
ncbi:hypothetical protein C7M84_023926 [Penaeus vannamei]|uniref:C3H1-type domain-containing protein n=1 Tax=Penaeus vannamei TaxID=6689 RepID=A0A423U2J5_PENVA|nr:hypothetical protein C7M84_023926 [Penaeus vannamei]